MRIRWSSPYWPNIRDRLKKSVKSRNVRVSSDRNVLKKKDSDLWADIYLPLRMRIMRGNFKLLPLREVR